MAMGHSPPIATRTGWISIAIMPFMIAFATKVNWIGMLTGTSHEKLQVFHRWSALVMYITSLIHTFVFIVQAIDLDEWEVQWKTNWYWTGIAALVPQTFLVFMSWGYFRNKYYETFKRLHFLAANVFMVFLFIHCCFRLTSWDYFAATAGIYFAAWFARYLRTTYNTAFGVAATLELLPDNQLLKLTVHIPPRVKWSPGQHFFIRFLNAGIHVFSSHPFTVTSLPSDGHMEFIFGVREGITKKLGDMVKGRTSVRMRVFIDGPYGGLPASLGGFDHVCLLAGGTGMTSTLPVLSHLLKDTDKMNLKTIDYLVAVKKRETATWLEDTLVSMNANGLTRTVHVTDPDDQSGLLKDGGSEDSSLSEQKAEQAYSNTKLVAGRPDLPALIKEVYKTRSGRVSIVACGPESFLYDVRNAVAECQLVLLDGYGECTDLYLHTENYSW
ncbi:hypothetical protein E1B28_005642 [Marasmius oreades]|nr:uncharacterized protein E1B28_005642 [Marasmius oreades]KAG7094832.1 hypothetical protein E1B28_005642 [Marasmius oreades]